MFKEKKVCELVGSNRAYTDHVGVEIEVEHKKAQFDNMPGKVSGKWRLEHDGSLRHNGGEYVMRNPLPYEHSKKAVKLLGEHIDNTNKVLDTGRAGVHIHVNVGDLSVRELTNFIALYHVAEPVITHWCGKYRKGNLFCLRTIDAEYLVDRFTEALEKETLGHLGTDEIRYSAINLKAIPQYGSVEFRAMRSDGNWDDINILIDVLLHLKALARQADNPIQIVAEFSGADKEEFVNNLLGKHADKFEKYDGFEFDMMDTIRIVQQYAYCREW